MYIAIYLENNGRIDQKMGENGEMIELLGNNNASVQKYKCANSDVEYSENTGKIFKMTFRVEP